MEYRVKAELLVKAESQEEAKRAFWDWIDDWMPGHPEDGKLTVIEEE